jgi:ribosomal protein L7/L12
MNAEKTKIPAEAAALLETGNTIEAIKIVRQKHGLGLKESKDLVDAYLREHPNLAARAAAVRSEQNKRALLWLLLIVSLAVILYRFFLAP